jgi:prevent-host-death family protein
MPCPYGDTASARKPFLVIECSNIHTFTLRTLPMPITTFTSRQLNQDVTRAKRACAAGPVFITDRGKPAHVLLSIDEYRRLSDSRRSIVDALSMPGLADIEFDPPAPRNLPRPAQFD